MEGVEIRKEQKSNDSLSAMMAVRRPNVSKPNVPFCLFSPRGD